jgi:hypothetical protein
LIYWKIRYTVRPLEFVKLGINGSYFINDYKDGDVVKLEVYDRNGKKLKNLNYEPLYYGSKGLMMRNLTVGNLPKEERFFVRVMRNNKLEREWLVDVVG